MKETKKKIFRFLDIFFIVLLVIILVFSFIYFYSATKPGNEFPSVFGYTPLLVVSGSMEPTINIDDIVIVKKAHFSELETGDIIVYFDRLNNMAIIHRLIDIDMETGKAITKGDANFSTDRPFSVTQIYGKMVFVIPFIGRVVRYLKSNIYISFIFAIAAFTYLIVSVIINKNNKTKQKINPPNN